MRKIFYLILFTLFFLGFSISGHTDSVTFSGTVSKVEDNTIKVKIGNAEVPVALNQSTENDNDPDDIMDNLFSTYDNESSDEIPANVEVGETVEVESIIKAGKIIGKRIKRLVHSSITCNGNIEYDSAENTITCNGITGIILSKENGDPADTLIIGAKGVVTTIDNISLDNAVVKFGYDKEEDGYFVKRIVEGPVVILRGKVTEKTDEYIKVAGKTVNITENTKFTRLIPSFLIKKLNYSSIKQDSLVRVHAQYINGEYYALAVFVANPRRVRFHGKLKEIRPDNTGIVETEGGLLNFPVKITGDFKPGDPIDFEGELTDKGLQTEKMFKFGEKPKKQLIKREVFDKFKGMIRDRLYWKKKRKKNGGLLPIQK